METTKLEFRNLFTCLGVISSILTIISFIYPLLHYLFGTIDSYLALIPWIAVFIFMLAVTIFLFSLARREKWYLRLLSWFMNQTAIDFGFKFTRSVGTYEYLSATRMKLTREFQVKVTRGVFTGFPIQYKWTGAAHVPAGTTCSGQILNPRDEEYSDGQQHYSLTFKGDTSYKKGETVPTMGFYVGPMEDTKQVALPYLSTSIPFPTDSLLIQVIFHRSLFPQNIRKLTYLHSTDTVHFDIIEGIEPKRYDDERDIVEWDIPHPIFGGKYVITWDFQ